MKKIRLTQNLFARISDKDFPRVSQYTWQALVRKRKDGSVINIYAGRSVYKETGKMRKQLLHRFILGVGDPKVEIDHKDRDGLNCQRRNLRTATNAQNVCNVGLRRDNTSEVKGVDLIRGKWRARINHKRRPIHIGYFSTKKSATKAYQEAAVKYHGTFAVQEIK